MALKRRSGKEDLLWLKWPLGFLLLIIAGSIGSYVSAFYFRNDMQRQELQALSELDLISGQVREIESSERIIVDNIDRFNTMVANGIMEQEDRVILLEEIRTIREQYQLFPIAVEIREQQRLLLNYGPEIESPAEQISLRSSDIGIQLPLLHEEDLLRFLAAFTGSGRLMLTSRCSIDEVVRVDDDSMQLVQNQLADCDFSWFTLRREPYTGI
jgi:hypothetical protein